MAATGAIDGASGETNDGAVDGARDETNDETRGASRSLVRYARPELDQMRTAILADRATGSTLADLATRYGVSIWAVRRVLAAAGQSKPGSAASLAAASGQPGDPASEGFARALADEGEASGSGEAGGTTPGLGAASTGAASTGGPSTTNPAREPEQDGRRAPLRRRRASTGEQGPPALPVSPSTRRRLTAAESRRLRALRALQELTVQDAPSPRLAEAVAHLWVEGAAIRELARAVGTTDEAIIELLRFSGVTAA